MTALSCDSTHEVPGRRASSDRRVVRLLGSPRRWPAALLDRWPLRRLGRALRESTWRRLDRLRRRRRLRYRPLEAAPARRLLFPVDRTERNGGWTYHDENWTRVIHRVEHRRLLREGRALTVKDHEQEPSEEVVCGVDGSVLANVAAKTPQEWVWLYLEPREHLWRDFRWELTARRDSDFRELQFGFRYVDFYNRYRFRHEDDHLHFDIVVDGRFRNSIHTVPFRMQLGRAYRYVIEARDNRFVLAIDGITVLDEVDRERLFPRGSIAIILWEDDGRTPIKASITDVRAVET